MTSGPNPLVAAWTLRWPNAIVMGSERRSCGRNEGSREKDRDVWAVGRGEEKCLRGFETVSRRQLLSVCSNVVARHRERHRISTMESISSTKMIAMPILRDCWKRCEPGCADADEHLHDVADCHRQDKPTLAARRANGSYPCLGATEYALRHACAVGKPGMRRSRPLRDLLLHAA